MGSYQIWTFEGPVEAFTALVLLTACVLTAHPLAATVTARHRLSHRWCATAIIASWLLTVLFYALASVSAFRLPIVATIWIALAGVAQITAARRHDVSGLFAADCRTLLRLLRHPPSGLISLVGLTLLASLAYRLAKGLVAPPLATDALTYHLLKAGRWVQQGGWAPETAPDAWSYYEHFPPGGDLFWAYAMVPGSSDTLIAIAGMLVVLVCFIGVYGASRAFDAPAEGAMGAALAVTAMPCVSSFLTSAYVTTSLLAELVLALTFIVLVIRSGRVADAVLAAAALGLAAGIQASALPLMALGLLTLVMALWWHQSFRVAWWATVLCLVACVSGLTGYLLTWMRTGSPLYPLALTIGNHTIWPGNDQLAGVLSGEYLDIQPFDDVLPAFAWALFRGPLNLGVGAILLIILGALGLWQLHRRHRTALLVVLALVAVPIAAILSDGMRAQRTAWALIAGRFVAPSVAALATSGSIIPGPIANGTRAMAALLGVVQARVRSLADVERAAMVDLAPYVVGGVALAAVVAGIGWSLRRTAAGVVAGTLVAIAVVSVGLTSTRTQFRYPLYRAAANGTQGLPYDQPGPALPLVAWEIWQALDDGQPHRIAFAGGWDYAGHTWYRYPLLGRKLQNTVLYVPLTDDGEVIDYRRMDRLLLKADFRAWVRRLIEQQVDVVVVAPPDVPELAWMRDHPSVFIPMGPPVQGPATHAFRVVTASASELVW